ncbi:A24 family peptidase [Agreia sp. COWG]|uniref:prepilin peptidase n=1 Tax=Agreia sp. COWG TaxID=2773266 RepID=UPI001F488F8C|nr:A24 family peptidase [Agreia sp. COWG]
MSAAQRESTHPFTARIALGWMRPWQFPVMGLLVAAAIYSFGPVPGILTAVWLALVSPALCLIDLRVHRLPNVLVVPGFMTLAADLAWWWAAAGDAPWAALVGAVVVGALLLVANLAGVLGMGDVKLAVVQAGCLGLVSPYLVTVSLMLALLAGGVVSAVLLVQRRADRRSRMPFGPFLIAGFWAAAVCAVGARSI